jgi:predicted transglutaminase-like cysteine proteinase
MIFAALLLALAPVAASTELVAPSPVDLVARAKFPEDKPDFIDALADFNKAVNAAIVYQDDQIHYGSTDHFVSEPPDGKGDCEDYALTKIEMLSNIGFPIVTSAKLVFVIVHEGKQVFGHAIVAIRLPSGSVAYLDLFDEPMTRAELTAKGYEFFDWTA